MNILLIYDSYSPHPLRQTFHDHLYSFAKYSPHRIYYCNFAYGIPSYLLHIPFDLVIFHQFFSAQFRWCGLSYEAYTKRLHPLKALQAPRALFCQDEFFKMDHITRFITDFDISHVFSVAEPGEWNKIYRGINRDRVQIHKVLTGYLDDNIEEVIASLQQEVPTRDIDIGYRAWQAPAWLGRQGKLKVEIAPIVAHAAISAGMKTNISTVNDEKNFFHGLDWYKFMLRCRCFIGVEGGSSLLDEQGEVYQRVKAFTAAHPDSSYEAIEQACFPGMDGNLNLVALSPRHLEACAARCCQILVEGAYSGILKPGKHYLELKRDFSNTEEVLRQARDASTRQAITESAWRDIVASKRYTYSAFVHDALGACLAGRPETRATLPTLVLYRFNQFREWLLWKRMPLEFYWFKKIKKILPRSLIDSLKQLRNRGDGV